MDSTIKLVFTILSCLSAFLLFIYYFFHRLWNPNCKKRLPRAGGALPIIGHLHLFGSKQLLHKTLGAMAEKYGAAFTIKLGSQEHLVISSWEMAEECFTTLDKVFAERPQIAATRILCYNGAMFGFAPYGPYWRQMRKIVNLELLSHRRIDMLSHVRASVLHTSLKELDGRSRGLQTGLLVDMKQWFGDLTMNTFVRMVRGKRANGDDSERSDEHKVIRVFFHYFGVFVLSDAIPSLAWLDLQGHERRMKQTAKQLDDLVGEWLKEHKQRRMDEDRYRVDEDFMDVMLTILEGADFPEMEADTVIKSTCMNMVLAGSDTIMVTLTWALSLLLNNPRVLNKAREEVDAHIGKDRHVKDSDIINLVYLNAVVKETMRLYPPGPVLGLRSAMEDCTLSPGYHVPSGTRLLVNIWKIQRDEKLWPEPHEFRPERFMTSHKHIDLRGHNFEFIPFGAGRRSCPGTSLALQMVQFTLATLLHCYDFKRASDAEIDMTETPGLTNLKATPLEVYVTPRLHHRTFGI